MFSIGRFRFREAEKLCKVTNHFWICKIFSNFFFEVPCGTACPDCLVSVSGGTSVPESECKVIPFFWFLQTFPQHFLLPPRHFFASHCPIPCRTVKSTNVKIMLQSMLFNQKTAYHQKNRFTIPQMRHKRASGHPAKKSHFLPKNANSLRLYIVRVRTMLIISRESKLELFASAHKID